MSWDVTNDLFKNYTELNGKNEKFNINKASDAELTSLFNEMGISVDDSDGLEDEKREATLKLSGMTTINEEYFTLNTEGDKLQITIDKWPDGQSGNNCLWNIAQNTYDIQALEEMGIKGVKQKIINAIAEANGIENQNLVFLNQTITLPALESFLSPEQVVQYTQSVLGNFETNQSSAIDVQQYEQEYHDLVLSAGDNNNFIEDLEEFANKDISEFADSTVLDDNLIGIIEDFGGIQKDGSASLKDLTQEEQEILKDILANTDLTKNPSEIFNNDLLEILNNSEYAGSIPLSLADKILDQYMKPGSNIDADALKNLYITIGNSNMENGMQIPSRLQAIDSMQSKTTKTPEELETENDPSFQSIMQDEYMFDTFSKDELKEISDAYKSGNFDIINKTFGHINEFEDYPAGSLESLIQSFQMVYKDNSNKEWHGDYSWQSALGNALNQYFDNNNEGRSLADIGINYMLIDDIPGLDKSEKLAAQENFLGEAESENLWQSGDWSMEQLNNIVDKWYSNEIGIEAFTNNFDYIDANGEYPAGSIESFIQSFKIMYPDHNEKMASDSFETNTGYSWQSALGNALKDYSKGEMTMLEVANKWLFGNRLNIDTEKISVAQEKYLGWHTEQVSLRETNENLDLTQQEINNIALNFNNSKYAKNDIKDSQGEPITGVDYLSEKFDHIDPNGNYEVGSFESLVQAFKLIYQDSSQAQPLDYSWQSALGHMLEQYVKNQPNMSFDECALNWMSKEGANESMIKEAMTKFFIFE